MTSIIRAKTARFCAGVSRAEMTIRRLAAGAGSAPIYTLGPLIHNERYIEALRELGVFALDDGPVTRLYTECGKPGTDRLGAALREIVRGVPAGSCVVLRTHGSPKGTAELLEGMGMRVVDQTCPDVAAIHRIVGGITEPDAVLVIIGDRRHPEVIGTESYFPGEAAVIDNAQNLLEYLGTRPELARSPVYMVSQTTGNVVNWVDCQKILKNICTNATIFDTICSVTEKRQLEAAELAARCEAVFVVGSTGSANSRGLYELCRSVQPKTHMIGGADELDRHIGDITGNNSKDRDKKIGIVAGASTPESIITEVMEKMAELINNEQNTPEETAKTTEEVAAAEHGAVSDAVVAASDEHGGEEEQSFEEMLNQTFKSVRTGQRVTGVITYVSPAELHIDLGTKHTGILAFGEATDDSSVELADLYHVGDKIDAIATRVNDVEGIVELNRKRIIQGDAWTQIEASLEDGAILDAKVGEPVNGGIIASIGGHRVFIPASQTGLGREENLEQLRGKMVRVKIIDIDSKRKRAIASVRAARADERRLLEDDFWAHAEIGRHYTGTVKNLASYGAFVDLGGVDGLVHISELSWSRIKHPSEVVKPGDKIDVYIKDMDREHKKLSLGYKNEADDPWHLFTEQYKVGDIADVRINSLMPFGAFAQVVPGADGLIHISQLSSERVQKPSDVVKVGDVVRVKITDIDYDKKKISLSMRAITEQEQAERDEQFMEDGGMGSDGVMYSTDDPNNNIEE